MSRRVHTVTDAPRRGRTVRQRRADIRAALVLLGRAADDVITAHLRLPLLTWLARRAARAVRTRWRRLRYGATAARPSLEPAVVGGTVTTPREADKETRRG